MELKVANLKKKRDKKRQLSLVENPEFQEAIKILKDIVVELERLETNLGKMNLMFHASNNDYIEYVRFFFLLQ